MSETKNDQQAKYDQGKPQLDYLLEIPDAVTYVLNACRRPEELLVIAPHSADDTRRLLLASTAQGKPTGTLLVLAARYVLDSAPYNAPDAALLTAIARVFEFGARKGYARGSWRTVPDARRRYAAALLRHALEPAGSIDQESGLPHAYACLWNTCVLLQLGNKEQK